MTNIIIKISAIVAVVAIATFIALCIYVDCTFSFYDQNYTTADLMENYDKRSKEIADIKTYVRSIMQMDDQVEIEFDGDERIPIFHVTVNGEPDDNWNLKLHDLKTQALLSKLNWSKENLSLLKAKLDGANCISVSTYKVFTVGFQRSGMGIYFYMLLDNTLTTAEKKAYLESCDHILYRDNIVLKFGGGAIGPQCFN